MLFQDSLAREKHLEDKLGKVRSMVSKHIGRSQTDLMRIFEDVKEELTNLNAEVAAAAADDTKSSNKPPNIEAIVSVIMFLPL